MRNCAFVANGLKHKANGRSSGCQSLLLGLFMHEGRKEAFGSSQGEGGLDPHILYVFSYFILRRTAGWFAH